MSIKLRILIWSGVEKAGQIPSAPKLNRNVASAWLGKVATKNDSYANNLEYYNITTKSRMPFAFYIQALECVRLRPTDPLDRREVARKPSRKNGDYPLISFVRMHEIDFFPTRYNANGNHSKRISRFLFGCSREMTFNFVHMVLHVNFIHIRKSCFVMNTTTTCSLGICATHHPKSAVKCKEKPSIKSDFVLEYAFANRRILS